MRFLNNLAALLILPALVIACPPAFPAQQSPQGAEADSAAIKGVFVEFYENFTRHDAHATAMTFAPDADFTNMNGIHRRGRKEIEDGFAALFNGRLKDSVRTDIVRNIRFYSPDLAVVDADTQILGTKTANGSVGPARMGLMIVTMAKQNGHWLISTFHEAEFPVVRSNAPDHPTAK